VNEQLLTADNSLAVWNSWRREYNSGGPHDRIRLDDQPEKPGDHAAPVI